MAAPRKRESLKPISTQKTIAVAPRTTASGALPRVSPQRSSLKPLNNQDVKRASITQSTPELMRKTSSAKVPAHQAPETKASPSARTTSTSAPPRPETAPVQSSTAPAYPSTTPKTAPLPRRNIALGQVVRMHRPDDVELKRPETIDIVIKYLLGQVELRKFRDLFDHIDVDRAGTIDYDEFFDFIEDRRTKFSDNLFRQIDPKYDGTLDFEHFVHILTSYCMRSREEILQFAFDTFDDDASGSLDELEFTELAKMMHDGKPVFASNFNKALAEFDTHGDGTITFAAFQQISKRYPMVLFPAFRLQDQMQRMSLGLNHWHKIHMRYFDLISMEVYRKKHNGAAPPIPTLKKIKLIFGVGTFDVYQPQT